MKELRPNYYKNRKGLDIFWKMETGCYPYQQSIGFCRLSIGTSIRSENEGN